jgi:hypothetical protein
MTRQVVRALVLAIMFGLGATTAWAQAALSSRTSIDVAGAAPQDVFGSLAKTLECSLDLQAEIQTPVTLKVSNISVRTALSVLCETLGCSWSIDGGALRIRTVRTSIGTKVAIIGVPKNGPVLLQKLNRDLGPGQRFENRSVLDVLAALSKTAEMEITTDEPLASRVITVDLSNRSIDTALREILKQAGAGSASYLAIDTKDGQRVRLKLVARTAKAPARTIRLGKDR